jgi:hypothetical protein
MTEQYLTKDEFLKRLKLEPEAVKVLLAELIAEYTKEYLTIEELAQRLTLAEKTVKNKMAAGVFQKGIHYFSPQGLGPRFKWSAVVAWLEESQEPATESDGDLIPMARGYQLGKPNGPIDTARRNRLYGHCVR